MCIFVHPVERVFGTQIFARLADDGFQYLAYQMNYNSKHINAMILPIPVENPTESSSIEFINLKKYENLFSDLQDGFPFPPNYTPSIGCASSGAKPNGFLEIFKVGNYQASFIPSIADFTRLDPKFRLPQQVWEKIPSYASFSFVVFQLASGSFRPHPMAFKFRKNNNSVFFPTVHIHDGKIHEKEMFDHELFVQHGMLDSQCYTYRDPHHIDSNTKLTRSKYIASSFCDIKKSQNILHKNLLVHRKVIRGSQPNIDIEIPVNGSADTARFNPRHYVPYIPWVAITGFAGWLFYRRNKISKEKKNLSKN